MSVFGGDSSWRKDTPGAYMLDVVRSAGSFGDSFAKAFSQAKSEKQQQGQFDAKQKEEARQFDASMAEKKREFDVINPAMPSARPDAPATGTAPTTTTSGPDMSQWGTPGFSWDGKPQQSSWQQYKAKTPTDAISAVFGAKTIDEAANIRQANADWEANPTYRRWMDDAFKAPKEREQARISSERAKIAASREANLTIGSQVMADMGRKFNTDMAALSKIDDVAAQRILEMPMTKHETLGMLPSAAQRAALGNALTAAQEKQRAAIAEAAAAAKLEPSAINAKGGVSYARPFATASNTGKLPQENTDARKILESEMSQTRRDIARVNKQIVDAVDDKQKAELRKQAEEFGAKLKASEAEYMRLGNRTNAPAAPAPAGQRAPSNDPLGLFQ